MVSNNYNIVILCHDVACQIRGKDGHNPRVKDCQLWILRPSSLRELLLFLDLFRHIPFIFKRPLSKGRYTKF